MMPRTAKKSPFLSVSAIVILAISAWLPMDIACAVSGDGLIAYPTTTDPENELSQTWFIYGLPAGGSKKDSLTLKNDSDQEASISLYAVDSTTNNMGEFALENESDSRDQIGRWITLESSHLILKPQEERQVGFTISIPQDAPVGETSGGIIIQKDLTEAQKNTTSGFVISTRIGIRVYETVPGDILRGAGFQDAGIGYDKADGTYVYTVTIRNEGNVSLESTVRLRLEDMLFGRQGKDLEQKILIPRGEEQKVAFTIDDDIFGRFEATATVEYAKVDGSQEMISTPAPLYFFAYPHGLISGLVILLLFNLFLIAIRRLRKASEKRYYADYRVQDGDNLGILSERFGIGWKKIIKLNGLKPPYQLEKGQLLRLIDKKHILSPQAADIGEVAAIPVGNDRRSRQEAFEKDLALISDDRPAALPKKTSAREGRISKKIMLFLLLAGGGYFLYTQVILKGNDAHFVYDRSMDGTAAEEGSEAQAPKTADTTDSATEEASVAAENPADDEITDAERKTTRVEILNGSGVKGASGKAAALFKEKGYSTVTTGNADRFDYAETSLACGRSISPAVCREAMELISEDHPSVKDSSSMEDPDTGKITVILGR